MKKLLFIFIVLFMSVNNINASEWTEEKLEGDNVDTEYRYMFYKEEKVGEYLSFGHYDNYEFEDKDDFIYGEYSNYADVCVEKEGYEIGKANEFIYKELLPIGFIKIKNLSDSVLEISSIEIYEKSDLISYNFLSCSDCSSDNYSINSNGELILKLGKMVNFRDLKLLIDFSNIDDYIDYEIVYGTDNLFSTRSFVASINGNSNNNVYESSSDFKISNNYTVLKIGYDIKIDDFIKVTSIKSVCRYREIKPFYYNINKKYYDNNYYKDVSELINISVDEQLLYKKDLDNYKVFYRYKDSFDNFSELENTSGSNNYDDDIKLELVKTGREDSDKNYKYLIMYVLSLLLLSLVLIKYIRRMSNEYND